MKARDYVVGWAKRNGSRDPLVFNDRLRSGARSIKVVGNPLSYHKAEVLHRDLESAGFEVIKVIRDTHPPRKDRKHSWIGRYRGYRVWVAEKGVV